jgi:hypothetical protein
MYAKLALTTYLNVVLLFLQVPLKVVQERILRSCVVKFAVGSPAHTGWYLLVPYIMTKNNYFLESQELCATRTTSSVLGYFCLARSASMLPILLKEDHLSRKIAHQNLSRKTISESFQKKIPAK